MGLEINIKLEKEKIIAEQIDQEAWVTQYTWYVSK